MSESDSIRKSVSFGGIICSLAIACMDFSFLPVNLRMILTPLQLWLIAFSVLGCFGFGKIRDDFALKVPSLKMLFRLIGEGFAAFIVLTLLMKLIMILIPGIRLQDSLLLVKNCSIPRLILLCFAAVITAPCVEELAFRHTAYGFLAKRLSIYPATVISSIVFTLLHGLIWQAVPLFLLSLFLQLVYCRRGSLIDSIIVHAVFNFCSLTGAVLCRFFS